MAAESYETLAKAGPVVLGAGPAEATLVSDGATSLTARLAAVAPARRLYLVLRGLRAEEPPETVYEIHLGLPRGTTPAAGGFHFIGTLNFFNSAKEADLTRFHSYDVTDLVAALQARKAIDDKLSVTIVPSRNPNTRVHPSIGEIALVVQ